MGKLKKSMAVVLSFVMLLAMGTTVYADSATAKIKVACVGDSITAYDEYWKPLQEILGDDYDVQEFAISGVTLTHNRAGYLGTEKHLNALGANPDIVVSMFGINDSNFGFAFGDEIGTANYKDACIKLVDSFREKNENVKIIIMSPTPQDDAVYSDGVDRAASNERMTEAIEALQEVAEEKGCIFLDIFTKFCQIYETEVSDEVKNTNVWEDGTHLVKGSVDVLADLVSKEVVKAARNKLSAGFVATNKVSVVQDATTTADVYIAAYKNDILYSIVPIENQALTAGASKILDTTGLDVEGVDYIIAYCWTGNLTPISEFCLVGDRFVQDGTTVTISGQNPFGANREHAILIKDNEGNVVYAAQTVSDADGTYTYTFTPAEGARTSYTILTEGKGAAIVEVVED